MQLLDYFDQSYVINLPQRVDRWGRWPSIEGDQFSASEVRAFASLKPFAPEDAAFRSIGTRAAFSVTWVLRDAHARNFSGFCSLRTT